MKVNSGGRGIPLRTSNLHTSTVDTLGKGQHLTGLQKFGDKGRRKQRRTNHIAKDLMTPKYRQRVKNPKHKDDDYDAERELASWADERLERGVSDE